MKTARFAIAVVLLTAACARSVPAQDPTPAAAQDSARKSLVQPGLGTLKQDEFTVGLRSGALLVKVTPLNERVIRLAAPDTYNRLHALADSRRAAALQRTGTKEPELFLVSFFSYQPDVTFQPEDLRLEYNGAQLQAVSIVPLTPSWGKQRMDQQETQAAIYIFSGALDFELPLVVRYGNDRNDDWQRIIPRLETERSRVLSKTPKTD